LERPDTIVVFLIRRLGCRGLKAFDALGAER
jgi:hypothetical protein